MAQGTAALFNEFSEELARGTHAFGTHTITIALITTLPVITQTTPTLSDFTVVSGGSYANVNATIAISRVSGQTTIDITNNPTWSQDGSGPTNIKAALIYNNTDASDKGIGFIDMTTDGGTTAVSMQAGDVSLTFNASGFMTIG
jgi:hypothetical protein